MQINEYRKLAMMTLNPDLDKKDILQMNTDKLKNRYPQGFSAENSISRTADDQ